MWVVTSPVLGQQFIPVQDVPALSGAVGIMLVYGRVIWQQEIDDQNRDFGDCWNLEINFRELPFTFGYLQEK